MTYQTYVTYRYPFNAIDVGTSAHNTRGTAHRLLANALEWAPLLAAQACGTSSRLRLRHTNASPKFHPFRANPVARKASSR